MSYILLAGMFLTGGVIIYILLEQHDNAMREFAVLGLFCSILTMLSYYVELNTPGIAAKVDAVKFGYIGKVFVNPMLLMLAVLLQGGAAPEFFMYVFAGFVAVGLFKNLDEEVRAAYPMFIALVMQTVLIV